MTIELAVLAALIGTAAGLLLGMLAASGPGKVRDGAAQTVALFGLAIPEFVLGTLVVAVLASYFNYFPDTGTFVPLTQSISGNLSQMLYPALVLSVGFAANVMRTTRSAAVEVARRRLRPDRRGQGPDDHPDPCAARPAQRRGTDRHHHRHPVRLSAGRDGDHRADLRAARPGPAAVHVDHEPRLPRRAERVLVIAVGFVMVNLLVDLAYRAIDPRTRAA